MTNASTLCACVSLMYSRMISLSQSDEWSGRPNTAAADDRGRGARILIHFCKGVSRSHVDMLCSAVGLMSLSVCMYVCMYIHIYIYTYMHIYIYMSVCVHGCKAPFDASWERSVHM